MPSRAGGGTATTQIDRPSRTTTDPIARPRPARIRSLDGLRGVAAAVVLVHHSLMTVPSLSFAYYHNARARASDGPLSLALTYTPLHLAWAGSEAVYLFFVLSGFVLTLPVLNARRFAWLPYYLTRGIRLYGPVWLAVALGALVVTATARFHADELGPWINHHPTGYTAHSLWRDVSLLGGSSGVIGPLWSLQWELWFSLLLPLYLLLLAWRPQRTAALLIQLTTLFALITAGSYLPGRSAFKYLPMFALGVLLAAEHERIGEVWRRMTRRRGAGAAVTVAALLLSVCTWLMPGLGVPTTVSGHFDAAEVAGCAVLVAAAVHWPRLRAALETRWALWLGGISFSLYLVHEPIVVAARYLMLGHPAWLGMLIGIPAALLAGWLFSRLVERRFHALARTAGRRLATD